MTMTSNGWWDLSILLGVSGLVLVEKTDGAIWYWVGALAVAVALNFARMSGRSPE